MKTQLFRNRLLTNSGESLLEPREMMMATPTFTGFLPSGTSDPRFSDVLNGTRRATSSTAQAELRQRVERDEIDDRGSRVSVRNSDFETSRIGRRRPIADSDIRLHTPLFHGIRNINSSSRWFQRDGNTQVFRVFPGDQNWFGGRVGAARSEAHVANDDLRTIVGDGFRTRFSARFNVAEHNGSNRVLIFQSKGANIDTSGPVDREPAWGVAMFVEKNGDITIVNRENQSERIDTGFDVGDSFDFEVVDNGNKYTVFLNGEEFTSGTWDRGNTPTTARWGAYVQRDFQRDGVREGRLTGTQEQVIYVSGAQVTREADPSDRPTARQRQA